MTARTAGKGRSARGKGTPARGKGPDARERVRREFGFGSALVAALERTWTAIRVHHPEVPAVVLVVIEGHGDKRRPKNGHFAPDAWNMPHQSASASITPPDRPMPEIAIAGERCRDGAAAVLSTLLHEAAHALAMVREIKDTSRNGRYHNKRFADLARDLTLDVAHDEAPNGLGWSFTTPTDTTRELYAAQLVDLDLAIAGSFRRSVVLDKPGNGDETEGDDEGGEGEGDGDEVPASGKRWALVCQCDDVRRISIVPSIAVAAPIVCRACGGLFASTDLARAVLGAFEALPLGSLRDPDAFPWHLDDRDALQDLIRQDRAHSG